MKNLNRVSGNAATTCTFHDEIDAILGTRAAGLLDSSTGADIMVPSEDDMVPGSPEVSLEENPAETSNSAIIHTTQSFQFIQSIVIQLLSAPQVVVVLLLLLLVVVVVVVVVPQLLLPQLLLAVVLVDGLSQESQATCKEVRGMLQGDLLVLREHHTLYWQKWKSVLMKTVVGGEKKEAGSKSWREK